MTHPEDQFEPEDPEEGMPPGTASQISDLHASASRSSFSRWLVLIVPLIAVALGGSKEPWVLGLYAMLVGACFILSPPKLSIAPSITIGLIAIVLLTLTAFLPISASSMPEWRAMLTDHLGIRLASLRTPQPWVTLESWVLMTVSIFWLVYCLGRGFCTLDRRFFMRGLTLAIAILSLTAIYVRRADIIIPLWRAPWGLFYFGPFPNRNHFATLLAVGGGLAFATTYDAYRNRHRIWILLAASMLCMFAGLLLNTSRAGIILFFLGLGSWMFLAGFRRSSSRRMAVFASILLVLSAAFIILGKPVMDRFTHAGGISQMISTDARSFLLVETLNLFGRQPWLGIGLGNFESIFALSKTYTDHYSRNLHPESDWLWFMTEGGALALLVSIVVLVLLLKKMGPFASMDGKGRKERRLRNAAAVGVFLIALHGVVDTPSHTIGIWAVACLLCGMALRPRKLRIARGPLARWTYQFCGVFCLVAGSLWLLSSSGRIAIASGSSARDLDRSAQRLSELRDYAGALSKLNQAIAMKPLQWNYYFDRATMLLEMGRSDQEALADFTRARELEPHSGMLCFKECTIWLKHSPMYALPALREAMQRDKSRAYGAYGFYGAMLQQMRDFPELRLPLLDLATEPKLKLVYLQYAITESDFRLALDALLQQAPNLDSLSKSEKRLLFRLWYEKGDKPRLISSLERNAEWKIDGWPVLAENLAANNDFRGAYQIVSDSLPAPLESQGTLQSDIVQLRRDFMFNPTDIARGLRLYGALRAKGLIDDAIYTLDKVAKLPEPPPAILYEQAVMYARKDDYSKAWERMKAYLALLPRDS